MADAKPLISIIVPFYNIESCVPYCMESLLCQTFDDFEIVCVDDGSTDGTGRLLDGFCDRPNVIVRHKENGGLSDARNHGLQNAQGEYITFVDGDDIVSPTYLEHMVKALQQNPGALIVGSFKNLAEDTVRSGRAEWPKETLDYRALSQAEAIDEFLHNTITESAWAKLAPKDAYRKPEFFPVGKVYEDLATFPGLLMQFERVAKVSNEDYGYILREGTISRARKTSIKQALDYVDALEALRTLPVSDNELAYRRALAIMRMHPILNEVADDPEAARALRRLGQKEVWGNLSACILDGKVSAANKIRIFSFAVSPALHDALLGVYARRLGGRS